MKVKGEIMFFKKYLNIILFVVNLCITISLFSYLYFYEDNNKEEIISNYVIEDKPLEDEQSKNDINVEVKGAVTNPGVYKLNEDQIINDVINLAGGFKKDAYTTNINLSKHLSDEMLIYVFTKGEYAKLDDVKKEEITKTIYQKEIINMCIENGDSIIISGDDVNIVNTTDLININTASKEELVTLNGIGDAKANAIIEYRNNNGLFSSIEDILKVSGISQTIYDKIKDHITV